VWENTDRGAGACGRDCPSHCALATLRARCRLWVFLGALLLITATIMRPPGKNKHYPEASRILSTTIKKPRTAGPVLATNLFYGPMACWGGFILEIHFVGNICACVLQCRERKGTLRRVVLPKFHRPCPALPCPAYAVSLWQKEEGSCRVVLACLRRTQAAGEIHVWGLVTSGVRGKKKTFLYRTSTFIVRTL